MGSWKRATENSSSGPWELSLWFKDKVDYIPISSLLSQAILGYACIWFHRTYLNYVRYCFLAIVLQVFYLMPLDFMHSLPGLLLKGITIVASSLHYGYRCTSTSRIAIPSNPSNLIDIASLGWIMWSTIHIRFGVSYNQLVKGAIQWHYCLQSKG